ncbi:uncharacterized protein [Triticum aestivum]|uniref:uncharacterized protein n=1 Tax=Triticum aestivum TaxID=4565 RepID=UPI001D02DDCB|nr:uncharacterized protein LOC123048585 [Triticum aestivum]
MEMTRSQSRRHGSASPGTGGSDRLPRFEGVMTRARRRHCGVDDLLPLACTRSGSESVRLRKRPRAKEWRDWANLTTDLIRDVAGRLWSTDSPWPAAQYNRLRAVCKTWGESTSVCSLDIHYRPHGWTPRQHKSGCRLRHVYVELDALSSNYIFAVTEGLFVLRDEKSTDIVRLLNPLTGSLTEFPPITKVRAYDGSELKSSQAINALKLYFSDPNALFCYFAGIDDSTSPPTLVFAVINNGELHVVYAKPGDHHWVSVHNLPNWAMWSDIGGLAWYFTPPPGVWLPKKIYVYSLGDS